MSEDLTVAILIEIRDEIRSTREELRTTREELRDEIRSTNHRVDQTNQHLEQLGTDLRTELQGYELRNATRITEQTAATRELYTMLTAQFELRDRVTHCEHEIDEIKRTLKKPNGSS